MKPIRLHGVMPVLVARLLPASLAMRILLAAALIATATCFGQPCGTWTLNPEPSTFSGGVPPKSFIVRIEPHPKGEVFTLDRTEPDGLTTSSSSILYLDGTARAFHDFGCSGTQSSRRVDGITVEILRQCGAGARTKLVRRTAPTNQVILEISEQRPDGRRFNHQPVSRSNKGGRTCQQPMSSR